jgi:hypothetical protein
MLGTSLLTMPWAISQVIVAVVYIEVFVAKIEPHAA